MKKIMNITTHDYDLSRFTDHRDLERYYKNLNLDGLEVMQSGDDKDKLILPGDVIGVHLKYFTCWMDLWIDNKTRLLAEYDHWRTCEQVFGGKTKQALLDAFQKNLEFATAYNPEYLVFHISECTIAESMKRKFYYSDKRVIDAAIELINQIVPYIKGTPYLLFENLWYPGLTMLRPKMTYRLLEGVNYPKKGVMLDIGHLLHTNRELRSLDEGADYVLGVLDQYEDLSFIKGVHLHQTLSGEYAEYQRKTWKSEGETYQQRQWNVMSHIYEIDSHKPFAHHRVKELIEKISPEYLVLEQISRSREEHEQNLREQLSFL